jgi:hypothetical protein
MKEVLDNINAKAALTVCDEQLQALTRSLIAARYVQHRLIVHKYASAVLRSEMSMELAWKAYEAAMANYDQIVDAAAQGATQELNQADTAKGANAITEAVENARA